MNRLPICLTLFTSTKGHWGVRDLYSHTLNHLDRQCPLVLFGERLAHIKVSTGDEALAERMETDLKGRGFHVIKTAADWSRGVSHQQGYLTDMRTVSMDSRFHSQRFMLLIEDDSPFVSHVMEVDKLLATACQNLEGDHEMVSYRTLRRGDLSTSPVLERGPGWFYSPHFNLQPAVLRTRDWYLAHRIIEDNWAQASHLQCELLLRLVFDQFSRRPTKHVVYHPDVAETFHLGVPDPERADLLKTLSLA